MSDKTVRVGIVGLKGRGSYLAEVCRRLPGVTVSAVADNDPSTFASPKVLERMKGVSARQYAGLADMLAREPLDAVMVATAGCHGCVVCSRARDPIG